MNCDLRVTTSTMKRMITAVQLNMSWTVAAAKALRNSLRSPICVSETIVFVTDVPILAPSTIGIATRTVKTIQPTLSNGSLRINKNSDQMFQNYRSN